MLWRGPLCYAAAMTALEFLNSLRPALPMSVEKPCTEVSNSELRRWMRDSSVLCNGVPLRQDAEIAPASVTSLIFFPKSQRKRTTLF